MAWRFLERFEHGMRGVAAKALGGFDDDRPCTRFDRVPRHEFHKAAYLADADVARIGVRPVATFALARFAQGIAGDQLDHVGVSARKHEPAGTAFATGAPGGGGRLIPKECRAGRRGLATLAIEEQRILQGEIGAADAFGTGEQQRVRRLVAPRELAEFIEDGPVTDGGLHGHRVAEGAA